MLLIPTLMRPGVRCWLPRVVVVTSISLCRTTLLLWFPPRELVYHACRILRSHIARIRVRGRNPLLRWFRGLFHRAAIQTCPGVVLFRRWHPADRRGFGRAVLWGCCLLTRWVRMNSELIVCRKNHRSKLHLEATALRRGSALHLLSEAQHRCHGAGHNCRVRDDRRPRNRLHPLGAWSRHRPWIGPIDGRAQRDWRVSSPGDTEWAKDSCLRSGAGRPAQNEHL